MSREGIFDKIKGIFGPREVVRTEILNIEMNVNLKSKYKKFLQREIELTNLSVEEILEAGLDLYAKANDTDIVERLSIQEELIVEFKTELRTFLTENLKPESKKYDVVYGWCDCIKDKGISTRNLDFQIRKIIEMILNKHQDTAREHFRKMGLDRYTMRDMIVKIIDEVSEPNDKQ